MVTEAIKIENEFSMASIKFEEMVQWLSSGESKKMTHSEIESQIQEDGRELLRLLLQSHLDARGLCNVGEKLTGSDGIIRSHKRETSRKLKSVFGYVEINRQSYGARGINSLHPKDAELNLPRDIHSHTMRKIVAKESSKGSFDEVVSAVDDYTGTHIAKRQIEDLVEKAAVDFDSFYKICSSSLCENTKKTGSIVVLTTDSKGIVMRKEDLRDATKKAAEKGENKLKNRISKGEKRNRKRMATVASVYTIEPFVRTPEQIAKELGPIREVSKDNRPKPEFKRVWASVEKPKDKMIEDIFKEAEIRDPNHEKQAVAVIDGDEKQKELIEDKIKEYKMDVTLILDIIHVLEYLWKASYVFYKEASKEAEEWVRENLLLILKGKSLEVASNIQQRVNSQEIYKDKRVSADKCVSYLLKYQNMMHYDEYLAAGYPIASGVIEGACRYLVKDRMDRTGARWSLTGAEAVLQIRALVASGDFEFYWDFHTKEEYKRNYDPLLRQTVEQLNEHKKYGHLYVVK